MKYEYARLIHRYLLPLALGLALMTPWPAFAQPAKGVSRPLATARGKINFSPDLIPATPASLPVLRLTPQKPPLEFVQEILRHAVPNAKPLAPLAENPQLNGKEGKIPPEIVGAFDEGQLAAYVDMKSGDAEVFPSLTRQKSMEAGQEGTQLERAMVLARETFARQDLLQKDATQFSLEKPRPLYGETAERSEAGGTPKTANRSLYLTYVSARRSVNRYFVYGPGSRALVVAGNDGSIQGFVRHWKTGTVSGEARETRTHAQVAEAILAQLRPASRFNEVTVMNVEIAYYDGNRNYLQPVYRFTAHIHELMPAEGGPARPSRVDDDFVVGYVAIGTAVEPLPSLITRPTTIPAEPGRPVQPPAKTPGDPTVGRYVVRNDDPNWVAEANEFWSGLSSFFGGALFTNAQYFWAYPFEFNTSEAAFVNSVNIAINQVHGDWWLFSTSSNCCDLVDITAIPVSKGYGTANGGHLSYWILHSCEVVPSAADAPCATDARPWWTPWFNIFRGLHTVVGYRTIMWIDDDVSGPYGTALRFGAPVVSAWFNATTSAAGYQGNPTYPAHCGNSPPMGRPSTVSSCGRENDWVYDTSALPAANCLINFWQPD
ncbi:MAG: DUF6345 domain-containing protein [Acidobacteriia bacterium]|nr:DUF6345 domain-containing protein [Terriglobia bacterium]